MAVGLRGAAAGFDIAIVRIAQRIARRAAGEGPTHEERLRRLQETARLYNGIDPAAFFAEPPVPHVREQPVRGLRAGGEVVDLSWDSG